MSKGELQTTDNNNIPRVISPGPDGTYLKYDSQQPFGLGYGIPTGVAGPTGPTGTSVLFAVASASAITSTSLVDITGLSIPLTAGTWIFEINISGNAGPGTAGAKLGVQYSGTSTSIDAEHFGQLATTTLGATARITSFNTGSTTIMTTASAQCHAKIFGQVVITGAGNLTARGLKVTSGTLTVNASSWMMAYKVS